MAASRVTSCRYVFLLLMVVPWIFFPDKITADLHSDGIILQTFLRVLQSDDSVNSRNHSQICSWKGIGCSGDRVVSIRLPGSDLAGTVPDNTLGNLTFLHTLSLRMNGLSGAFPFPDLARCSRLRTLVLSGNRLSGTLPSDLSIWPSLQRFDVAFNYLHGSVPSILPPHLNNLYLQNNSLSGPLPNLNVSSLTLGNFSVANNNLSGPIPFSLQTFPHESFSGNVYLCGPPLNLSCDVLPPPPSAPNNPPLVCPPLMLPPVNATSPSPVGRKKLSSVQITGIAVGFIVAFFFLLLCTASCFIATPNHHQKLGKGSTVALTKEAWRTGQNGSAQEQCTNPASETTAAVAAIQSKAEKLVILRGGHFEINELLRASAEVLGKGSMGTAYKAKLDERFLVVKRVSLSIGLDSFRDTMEKINQMQHENILPLIAYQYNGRSMLLIYDYMVLGSLDAILHGYNGLFCATLKWEVRCRIALSVAEGILFLHGSETKESSFKQAHGNIKSSNVLLKDWNSVYISDYGLTQLVAATTGSSSMLGYRAPEVIELRKVTVKADIYSFGVLLLELLTRKSPAEAVKSGQLDLPRLLQPQIKEGLTETLLDPELTASADKAQFQDMRQMLDLALECTAFSPDQRPKMVEVVNKIQEISTNLKQHSLWPADS